MEDIWIKNLGDEDEDLLNLADYNNIFKTYSILNNGQVEHKMAFRCKRTNNIITIAYKNKKERDNFYSHVQRLLKPIEINPSEKPITL